MAGEIGRKTDHWGSRFGFIMAAVGSSVGLGNFWRFPFTAGENGGGAFIIIYLFCVLFLGLTVLMAEYALGRKSGMSAIEGIHSLARAENKSENWQVVGWIGSLGAFFILTFYIVISAWVLAFIPQAFGGTFNGFAAEAARLTAETGTTVSIADVSADWWPACFLPADKCFCGGARRERRHRESCNRADACLLHPADRDRRFCVG